MKTRNFLALILSILMIVTMLPTNIFAAPAAVTISDSANDVPFKVHEHENNEYETAELAVSGTAGTVHYTIDAYGVMTISGSGKIPENFDSSSYINSNDKQLVKRIVIEDGITGIGQQSLDTFYNLTSVSIAETVTSIGQYVFVNCSKIKTITYWGTSRFTTTNILSSSVTPTIYVNTNYSNATMFGKTVTKILTDTSKECTVKFDMNGYGTQVDSQYVFNIDGYNKVTKPTDPSAPEVKFEGWYKDSEFNTAWNFDTDTVSDNTTIYAKWNTTPDHTVSFNMGSYGTVISDRGVVSGSLVAEPEIPTDDDALFLGWYKDSNFETPWDFASDTVTSDITLYAEWRLWYGTAPSTGDGSESSPFEIGTADELYWFADYYNNSGKLSSAYAILVDDITVNQNVLNADGTLNGDGSSFRVWQPIGNSSIRYVGTFDGQGHTISGLYFNNTDSSEGTYVGFIGRLGAGTVKNLEVADSYFKGYQNVGGIVGSGQSNTASYVENCKSSATVYASYQYAGGISGNYSTVKNSLFVGKVGGVKSVGAIYGSYQCAHISNCYYLTNCAKYDNGKVQYGIGTSQTNSNSTDGNNVNYFAVNTNQLASGEITYKLQGAQEDDSVVVWGQQLTGENADAYPTLGGPRVVLDTATGTYINSEEGSSHTRIRGYCCDEDYDEPVLVDESNCASLGLTSDYIGYYAISNYGQLYGFAKIVNGGDYEANAVLTDNIVANENVLKADGTLNGDEQSLWQWNPILPDGDVEAPEYADKYEGTFDGNNKYISGLYYNNSVGTVRGLFGYVGENGIVKNLDIVDSYFYGQRAVGAIAGYNFGNIENCYNEGTIKAYPKKSTGMMNESGYFGGIVGYNEGGIVNCHNDGYISGATAARWIGGICGFVEGGEIDKCYNTGTVDGTARVGGIVGEIYSSSVSNTYNTGDISSTSTSTSTTASVGGIAGVSNGNGVVVPEIKTSYNIGNVLAPAYVGGILGHTLKNPDVMNCYYLKDSAVDSNGSVDNGYGNALTLEQMTDDENWKTNFAGFDTTNVWSKETNTVSTWYLPGLDDNFVSIETPYIVINLGARASDTNIRYAEIAGVVSEIEENGDKYICQIGEENLLIEFVEKTAGGEVVRTQYFFVDMEAKAATKLNMDSYMTTDSKKSIRIKNPMGVRFKSNVLTSSKNEEAEYVIDEYGFIVATEDALGETELTLDFSKYVTGVAYNRVDGTDIVFDASDDEVHVFTGYVKNIPVAQYKTNLVCKTYTKITVDGKQFVLYGEKVVGNVYDTAKALLEDNTLDAETRNALVNITLAYENTIGIPGDDLYPNT